jgi:membrane fusion protein (multidrug efflux system)
MLQRIRSCFTKEFWQENWQIPNRKRTMGVLLGIVFGGIIALNTLKIILIKVVFAFYTPPPITVSSAKVRQVRWHPRFESVGNLLSSNGIEVNAQASGNISAIHFKPGQFIEAGQPLIDLDDSVEQAQLSYNKAFLKLQTINHQRQLDLFKRGAASPSVVDEAKASMDQAQAEVDKIQAQINFKHITAPFAGFLGVIQVSIGQYVTSGQTSIVTLQKINPLYLNFYIPEQMYQIVSLGQAIYFHVDAFSEANFVGKISAINSRVDPDTHNILVQATVNNCDIKELENIGNKPKQLNCDPNNNSTNMALVPGMFAGITLINPIGHEAVIIPSTAVSYGMYGDSVYVVYGESENDLYVKKQFVTLGGEQGNNVEVVKGLKAGMTIVKTGELKLDDNARVIIDNSIVLDDTVDINTIGE